MLLEVSSPSKQRIDGVIGSSLAEMAFGCPPVVKQAIHDAVESEKETFGYISHSLADRIGNATAEWLQNEYGWAPPVPGIRPVADLVAGFQAVLTHFTEPGDRIVVLTPSYMPFLSVPPILGRVVVEVPMTRDAQGWQYDFASIENAFAQGARMLVLCNPHNPIGKVANESELARLEQIVADADALVFSDEIHAPFVRAGLRHITYADRNPRSALHTITATSASKAFNIAGLKCGQLIFTNPEHLERWRRIGRWYEHQTSSLGIAASVSAYRYGKPWFDEIHERIESNLLHAYSILESGGMGNRSYVPEATYLMWIDLRDIVDGGPPTQLGERLFAQAALNVTDGIECGKAGQGFVRFNAALEQPELSEAMLRFVELGQP